MLKIVKESRYLVRTICKRKKNWIGHVLRWDGLLKDVLEGRIFEKRQTGQSSTGMTDDLMKVSFVKMEKS